MGDKKRVIFICSGVVIAILAILGIIIGINHPKSNELPEEESQSLVLEVAKNTGKTEEEVQAALDRGLTDNEVNDINNLSETSWMGDAVDITEVTNEVTKEDIENLEIPDNMILEYDENGNPYLVEVYPEEYSSLEEYLEYRIEQETIREEEINNNLDEMEQFLKENPDWFDRPELPSSLVEYPEDAIKAVDSDEFPDMDYGDFEDINLGGGIIHND